jgi:hypothetical protein
MRFEGKFSGRTTGLSWMGGLVVVLAILVAALAGSGGEVHKIGRTATEVIQVTEITGLAVAGLALAALVTAYVFWLRSRIRAWNAQPATPARPGTGVVPASQGEPMKVAGLPVGFYGPAQPHGEVARKAGQSQPAIENHHHEHLHFHAGDGEDPVDMARRWRDAQRGD